MFWLLSGSTAILTALLLFFSLQLSVMSGRQLTEAEQNGQRMVYAIAKDAFITQAGAVPPEEPITPAEVEHGDDHTHADEHAETETKQATEIPHKPEAPAVHGKDKPAQPEVTQRDLPPALDAAKATGSVTPTPPATSNLRAFSNPENKPMVVVIVTGLGLSRTTSQAVLNLPPEVTLALSPYSHFADELVKQYRSSGRDVLVEIPMEPTDYPVTDPGPYALMTKNELVENLSRLEWSLSRVKGAAGVMTPVDEKFSNSSTAFRQVVEKLAKQNMMVVFGRAAKPDVIPEIQKMLALPMLLNDVVIDGKIDGASIEESLKQLEQRALRQGLAIGICRPYPLSIKKLTQWSETLAQRGVLLAPVSFAYQSRGKE